MTNYKEEIIKYSKNNFKYLSLKKVYYDNDIENLIKELKEKYISLYTQNNLADVLGLSELAEIEKHSQQSEILGKIVMLVHEFKGYRGVQEILHEIFWEYQELINNTLESYELQVKNIEKSNITIKEKN